MLVLFSSSPFTPTAVWPSPDQALFGSNSLKIQCTGIHNAYVYTDVPVSPGLTYTLSTYGFISSLTSGAIRVQLMKTDGTVLATGGDFSGVGTWGRLPSLTYTIPDGVQTIRVVLNTTGFVGTTYFDGVLFEPLSTLNTYFDGSNNGVWTGSTDASTSVQSLNRFSILTVLEYIPLFSTLAMLTNLYPSIPQGLKIKSGKGSNIKVFNLKRRIL